jgi:quercetin dioxygenase-like cupin family protein
MLKAPLTFLAGCATGGVLAGMLVWTPASLSADGPQSAPAVGKSQSRVVLENDRVRVKEVIFPAGATRTGQHTHEFAHVGVILTEGALVFTEDGKSETVTFTAGQVGFRDANATHDVGNPGTRDMRVIEVELKK